MICTNCEASNKENAKYCKKCGQRISEKRTSKPNLNFPPNEFLKTTIKSKSTKRAIAGVASSLLLLIIFFSDVENWWFWGIGFLLSGYFTLKRLSDLEDKSHYCYKLVEHFSDVKSIDELSGYFSSIITSGKTDQFGKYQIYNNSIILKDSFFEFEILPLSLCTWVYKKVLSHKAYGLITTSKDYSVVMHFPYNKEVEITSSDSESNEHLLKLIYLCPNAKIGYTN